MQPYKYHHSRHWAPDDPRRNFTLTVWGNGTSCLLEHAGRSVYWQGDEAAEITDRAAEGGPEALPAIWAEYEDVSQPDEED